MSRRPLLTGFFALALAVGPLLAAAQGPAPAPDAAGDAPSASVPPSPVPPSPVPASPSPSATRERPARGPAVRERGGRRSRAGGAAGGAFMVVMLIAFMGYYVVKKLRR